MKYLRSIILALVMIALAIPLAVYATTPIASPSSYSISNVTVYDPALETGDQLYIVSFAINYPLPVPTTDAGTAWLIRLFNNGVEIASTTPYAFYNSGYSTGVASIYLPASMALPWSGANVSLSLEPNPTLTWASIPTQSIYTTIVWASASSLSEVATAVGVQVRGLASTLTSDWGISATPLVESANGMLKLTDLGASYFDVVMPTLRTIQPNLYLSTVIKPIIPDQHYDSNYQTSVDSSHVGTPLDETSLAGVLGLSRGWVGGGLWFLFCLLVSGAVGYKANTAKPVFFLFGGLMIVGGFMGFGLLQSIMFALLGTGSVVLAFAWRGA
jgi:hypothetical protein